jgi:molybdopterin synthase catalytic subunit
MPLEARRIGGGGGPAAKPPGGAAAVGTVVVRLFARAQDAVGESSLRLEIADGETIGSLLDRLDAAYPAFAPLRGSLLVAANYVYVPPEHVLATGDEIAIIPPVQGG